MSGYYAYMAPYGPSTYRAHGAWLAQIIKDSTDYSGLALAAPPQAPLLYPNPVKDQVSVPIELEAPAYLRFELYNGLGQLVAVLWNDWVVQT